MDVEAFREHCLAKKGAVEEFPFGPENLVFKVMGKMFALVPLDRIPAQGNLKCDPERALELREAHDGKIIGGHHMNKRHWNTLYFDQLPPQLIRDLVDHSYELVLSGLPKKLREELQNLG